MNKKDRTSKTSQPEKRFSFLILSCSGGAGHIRAAQALYSTARLSRLPITVEHYDVLDFTSSIFKKLYSGSYLQMVNRAPELWGYLYQQSEKKPYERKGLIRLFDNFNYKRYLRTLQELRPDAIICTHFLPYISVSSELRKNNINAPVFSATTDFDVHQLWIDNIVEQYFVFHGESAWQLHSKNVPMDKISIMGIPVMPEFLAKGNLKTVQKKLGLKNNHFTLLVLSGGFGVGRVKDIAEHVASTLGYFPNRNFNLIIVCGKNKSALAELQAMRYPKNVEGRIFGFVNNIHELMDASDILISKAGGLTSSEALAKSLPMLIIDPIPGQESRNADLIVENGAGWKAVNLANLSYKLHNILSSPSMLVKAQSAATKLAKPDAAMKILKHVYTHLNKHKELIK